MSENGDRPVTIKDLSELEARLFERIHDTETKIVSEFYKWARHGGSCAGLAADR